MGLWSKIRSSFRRIAGPKAERQRLMAASEESSEASVPRIHHAEDFTHYALERDDGGVSIMAALKTADVAKEVSKWEGSAKGVRIIAHAPLDHSTMPASRRFRAAWKASGGKIEVDAPRAKDIAVAEMRAERNRRLNESDKMKTQLDDIGTPAEQKALRDYRQALRDLPASEEQRLSSMTLAELEAYVPAWPAPPA